MRCSEAEKTTIRLSLHRSVAAGSLGVVNYRGAVIRGDHEPQKNYMQVLGMVRGNALLRDDGGGASQYRNAFGHGYGPAGPGS